MGIVQPASQNATASIWFLKEKDLYATVKPYSLAFTPAADIPRENIERTEVSVEISDIRGRKESFNLNQNGFMVISSPGEHAKVDWDNERSVREVHCPNVISEIKRAFPGSECIPLASKVRLKSNMETFIILLISASSH